MMAAAGFSSSLLCVGCCFMKQQTYVGNVGIAAGRLRETRSRREQVYHRQRNVFPAGPKLASSPGRHVVLERCMSALLRCTSLDTNSAILTHENVSSGDPKVKLRLKVDHHIQFGEHVALLGSSESAGSWNNRVMLGWTEDGWVVDLQADPGETIEYKYVVITKDGNVVWEDGENRVLVVPDDFSKCYLVVSHWSATTEGIDFEVIEESRAPEDGKRGTEQALNSEMGDFEAVDVTQSPANGTKEMLKEAENESVDYKVINETQSSETVVKKPELELELEPQPQPQPQPNVFETLEKSDEKRVVPYNGNSSDLTSSTWWGPVSIILSILLIVYGFVNLSKN